MKRQNQTVGQIKSKVWWEGREREGGKRGGERRGGVGGSERERGKNEEERRLAWLISVRVIGPYP